MNAYQLTEDQRNIQGLAREIAQTQLQSIAKEIDEQERFPEENIRALADAGILGCCFDQKYGGGGQDFLSFVLAEEEVSKVCGATGSIIATHCVAITCLNAYGTPEQKAKYMPLVLQGHLMGFAMTEADAGSDGSYMNTTAERDGDNYIINGAKMFISSAPANEFHIVITVTGKDERGRKQFTAFIVDRDTPGFSVGKHFRKLGIRGSLTAEIVFDECVVPASQMLGKEGEGMKVALSSLDTGRICMGTQALGIAQGAIDATKDYVTSHMENERRLSQSQNTQFVLADLQTRVDAGRLLLWHAAALKSRGENFSMEAAMGKLYNSDLAVETTSKCLQFLGEDGLSNAYPVERMMRDSKITQIYEGTNEIQKMVIARSLGIK
jgi:butyryl-CoA dehydrogenase